jgi:hypothetical protein
LLSTNPTNIDLKAHLINAPTEVNSAVLGQIKAEVDGAIKGVTTNDGLFTVNNTHWYSQVRSKAKPTVMNSAKFISSKILRNLLAFGWELEPNLEDQRIDARKTFISSGGFKLERKNLTKIVEGSWNDAESNEADFDIDLFPKLYRQYHLRECFEISTTLAIYQNRFKQVLKDQELRVGLEFETGNIASSFRALSKLDSLYKKQIIDLGVFITSLDKASTACVIWPPSNRNGSFEELQNRDYKRNVQIPLIEYAFSPDQVDLTSSYLAGNGTLYTPQPTGRTVSLNNRQFDVHLANGEKSVLLPT